MRNGLTTLSASPKQYESYGFGISDELNGDINVSTENIPSSETTSRLMILSSKRWMII